MRLQVTDVTKRFPGVVALDQVSLGVGAGEVLAVIGENGAGKSTLMKVLAGINTPDSGTIAFEGQRVRLLGPSAAIDLGISLIHQELNLHENLTIAENIYLGREPARFGWIDRRQMNDAAEQYTSRVGLRFAPTTPLRDLSTAARQLVEIAKALSTDASVVIMDEPTSSLSTQETEKLYGVVDGLRADDVSVIYISHRLAEVNRLADRVEVLRDGKNSGSLQKDAIDHDAMVSLMVGRDLSQLYKRSNSSGASSPSDGSESQTGQPVMVVSNLVVPVSHDSDDDDVDEADGVSFSLNRGEIVGIAGLVGSGRTELLESVFGVRAAEGKVTVDGKTIDAGSIRGAMNAGLALVPEDRKGTGLLIDSSVMCNTTLAGMATRPKSPWMDRSWQAKATHQSVEQLAIKTASIRTLVRNLSGGNQQKIALAKWLVRTPKVLLMDEPTRGVDIGAKQEIYRLLDRLAGEGLAILFVSSEMEEVISLSDRVLVMHDGRLATMLSGDQINEESIMNASVGGSALADSR